MKTYLTKDGSSGGGALGIEAGRWLLDLQEEGAEHSNAFLAWITQSPKHVEVFLETFEAHRLLGSLDSARTLNIQALLNDLGTDVIRLERTASKVATKRRRGFGHLAVAAAAAALLAGGAWYSFNVSGKRAYTTAVGEQRTCKLADGSFVYLNTDSRIEVRFSESARTVSLVRGEALFAIEPDSRRPFTVSTQDARIRVLGTRFNVRRRAALTDVAVLDGLVQVSALGPAANSSSPLAKQLHAGEEVRVSAHQGLRVSSTSVRNVLAWRARRLVFTEAPLGEVAAEFNRYNERKIRVEDQAAGAKRMTGIFDADRPTALIMYAMKDESLIVEPKGDEWTIRTR